MCHTYSTDQVCKAGDHLGSYTEIPTLFLLHHIDIVEKGDKCWIENVYLLGTASFLGLCGRLLRKMYFYGYQIESPALWYVWQTTLTFLMLYFRKREKVIKEIMSLKFLGLSHRILAKVKSMVYRLEMSLVRRWKMRKMCKWEDWWCHSLNPI